MINMITYTKGKIEKFNIEILNFKMFQIWLYLLQNEEISHSAGPKVANLKHSKMKYFIFKVLRIWEDVGGFLSSPGKKLSTFDFFSWQKKTFLLTENQKNSAEKSVQIASTFSWFFSATPKTTKIQMFSF